MNTRRVVILGLTLLLGVVFITRCMRGNDSPYASVGGLSAAADVVVSGEIGALRGTEVDDGGDEAAPKTPVAFYDFDVDDVLGGSAVSGTIAVAWPDLSKGDREGYSPLEEGDDVVLFLAHRTNEQAPGIDTETDFYVPIAGDASVFDIDGSRVVARSEGVRTLDKTAAETDLTDVNGRISSSLDTFAAVVARNVT